MRRTGVALPLVLLLLVALTGLAHGLGVLTTAEARASRAAAEAEAARVLAAGVARLEAAGLSGDSLPTLLLWAPESLGVRRYGPAEVESALERVGREWHLLRVRSRNGPGVAWWRGAWPLWSLDPVSRVVEAPAVVVRGRGLSVEPGSAIDGGALWSSGDGSADPPCPLLRAAADSLLPAGRLPGAVLRNGQARLGLLGLAELLRRLPGAAPGSVTPTPVVEAGRCRGDAPGNWGSPSDPAGPCGDFRPARAVDGDLRLGGGEGQGVLVVRGSLRVSGGALFAGVVVAGDSLVLEDGARILGLAVAGGSVRLRGSSRIEGRGCPAGLALAAAPTLRGPLLPAGPAPLRVH